MEQKVAAKAQDHCLKSSAATKERLLKRDRLCRALIVLSLFLSLCIETSPLGSLLIIAFNVALLCFIHFCCAEQHRFEMVQKKQDFAERKRRIANK